jgi:hypothetical protein
MKPRPRRLRLVVDNTGRSPPSRPPPPPPRWIDTHREEIVTRALALLRHDRIPHAEKERLVREFLDREPG